MRPLIANNWQVARSFLSESLPSCPTSKFLTGASIYHSCMDTITALVLRGTTCPVLLPSSTTRMFSGMIYSDDDTCVGLTVTGLQLQASFCGFETSGPRVMRGICSSQTRKLLNGRFSFCIHFTFLELTLQGNPKSLDDVLKC